MSKPSRRPGREEIKAQTRKKTRATETAPTTKRCGTEAAPQINTLQLSEYLQ